MIDIKQKDLELTHFTQIENGVCDNDSDEILTLKKLLEGRGQPGFAGFFEYHLGQLLIKVDDSATCVMEGSAGFAQSVIPKGYESSVNFAHAGTLNSINGKEAISIQKKAEGYQPWDEVVYGHKRNPKTPISYEWWHEDKIRTNINNMHENARFQLAIAIFISTLVGDESLHVGQFMAKTDNSGQVTDIMRIDFGARERFALHRLETEDFKHETSVAYNSSGQFGKDYISYLLAHPDIKQKYLKLWAQEMDIIGLGEASKQEFMRQINNIPPEKIDEALEGVWETLSRKSSSKKPESLTLEAIGDLLKNSVITRATMMQKSARDKLKAGMTGAPNREENIGFGVQIKQLILNDSNASVMLFDLPKKVGFKDVSFADKNHAKEFCQHFPGIICEETSSGSRTFYAFTISKEQLKEKLASLLIISEVKKMLNKAPHNCNILEIKRIEIAGEPIRYEFILNNDPSTVTGFTKKIWDLKIVSELNEGQKKCRPVEGNPARSSMFFSERQFIQLQNALWSELKLPVPNINVLATSTFGQSQQFFNQPSVPDVQQRFLAVFENQKFDDSNIVDGLLFALSGLDSLTQLNIIEEAAFIVKRKCTDPLADEQVKKCQDGHIKKLQDGYQAVLNYGLSNEKSNSAALCKAWTASNLMPKDLSKESGVNKFQNSFLR